MRYAYDFNNDGTFDVGNGTHAGSATAASASVPANFLADGLSTRLVRGRIMDDDGGFTDYTTTITINNVPPANLSLSLSAATINENSATTLNVSFTDPGVADTHTVTINWGDGSANTVVSLAAGVLSIPPQSHQYADDKPSGTLSDPYTISVTVTDDDGGSASASTIVTVNNVAPAVGALAAPPINENGIATISGSYVDPGLADSHTVTVDWDNPNSTGNSVFQLTEGEVTLDFEEQPPGSCSFVGTTFTSQGFVFTKGNPATSGYYACNPFIIHNSNSLAMIDANAASHPVFKKTDNSPFDFVSIDAGTRTGSSPSTGIVITGLLQGGGTVTTTVTFSGANFGTFALPSTFVNLVQVNLLAQGTGQPEFLFDNLKARISTGGGTGLSVGNTFASTTPGDSSILTVTSVNNATGTVGFSVTHKYLDDGSSPGNASPSDISNVALTVADDDGGSNSTTAAFTVNNVAPSGLTLGLTAATINENGSTSLSGSFADPGTLDGHTLSINWGDGSAVQTVTRESCLSVASATRISMMAFRPEMAPPRMATRSALL